MLRSMTGFGRYFLDDGNFSQTWEVRSVNSRFLDLKWRLPSFARSLETLLEKVVRKHAARGRVEISLNLRFIGPNAGAVTFKAEEAEAMLGALKEFSRHQRDDFVINYNALLGIPSLWEEGTLDLEGELGESLIRGLTLALEDWNEARVSEARALERDIAARLLLMREWTSLIEARAPLIKEERFSALNSRLTELLENMDSRLDEGRFLQEITILADKLDVSEELTRLKAQLERLHELLAQGNDAGRRLDFTIQECFREINTCGNKIQDAQLSRVIVDFKNELEKCREQVQNIE
ncbi:MAG: YicC family protein [Deltaproteobacteria bacterium]|jgi:uncharacterized protein (TIGR00255 family)|nr:YicC family protein [Deltaproteobacteria bacterium]